MPKYIKIRIDEDILLCVETYNLEKDRKIYCITDSGSMINLPETFQICEVSWCGQTKSRIFLLKQKEHVIIHSGVEYEIEYNNSMVLGIKP